MRSNSTPQTVSESLRRIETYLPSTEVFTNLIADLINSEFRALQNASKEVFKAIDEYFYVAYKRQAIDPTQLSILTTLKIENSTGVHFKGVNHFKKAASIYCLLRNTTDTLGKSKHNFQKKLFHDATLTPEQQTILTQHIHTLQTLIDYFLTLNAFLLHELKIHPSQEAKNAVKKDCSLDIDAEKIPEIKTPQHNTTQILHRSPLSGGKRKAVRDITNDHFVGKKLCFGKGPGLFQQAQPINQNNPAQNNPNPFNP